MLTNQELRELSRPSAANTVFSLLIDWVLIVALFAVFISWPNPLTFIVAFIGMGRQQLALAIMMHDAAHRRLFQNVKLNEYVGQWLTAAPLLFSMFSYRTLHLKHHQNPLASDDPDLSLISGYPISKSSFARKILRDATGVSYFKFIKYFIHMARKPKKRDPGAENTPKKVKENVPVAMIVVSILVVNALLFGTLFVLGHGWLYLVLWLLPEWTVLQVLLRVRGIAEHAGYAQNDDQKQNARTVINPVQTFVFAPHHVNYHIEHHVYPSIPHFNLPKAHKLMRERKALPESNIYSGYGKVLKELIR